MSFLCIFRETVCVKLSLVSWYDNEVVSLLSAFVGSEPISTKTRYFRKDKQYKDIPSPQSVDVYNRHMGEVDLRLYRLKIRYKKNVFGVATQDWAIRVTI